LLALLNLYPELHTQYFAGTPPDATSDVLTIVLLGLYPEFIGHVFKQEPPTLQ
jgi:hypothetical protein